MNSIAKLGIAALSRLAHELHIPLTECTNDLPLDYCFENPDASCVLEYLVSCQIYRTVYGWGWKTGLIQKDLPEADAYSQDPKDWTKSFKMTDILSEFLQKGEISHVAVLSETQFAHDNKKSVSKLLIYRFDKGRYETFIK